MTAYHAIELVAVVAIVGLAARSAWRQFARRRRDKAAACAGCGDPAACASAPAAKPSGQLDGLEAEVMHHLAQDQQRRGE